MKWQAALLRKRPRDDWSLPQMVVFLFVLFLIKTVSFEYFLQRQNCSHLTILVCSKQFFFEQGGTVPETLINIPGPQHIESQGGSLFDLAVWCRPWVSALEAGGVMV